MECHLTDGDTLPVYDRASFDALTAGPSVPELPRSSFLFEKSLGGVNSQLLSSVALPASAKSRSELALYLRCLRRRIDPDTRVLGTYARLPQRLGKRVTQEELAEAIGVSREWYGVLESTSMTRTSTRLVERLADALMVTPEERATLFRLALPELGRVRLREDSVAVLGAFSHLRSLAKRLWTATSVDEALTMAREDVPGWFDGAIVIETSRRRDTGLWESQAVDDNQNRHNASSVVSELGDRVLPTPQSVDGIYLYPQLSRAGDIGDQTLLPPAVWQEIQTVYTRRRLPRFTFLCTRVQSRTGLVAGLCVVHELGHSYSAADRAIFGAVAEITSLALS